MAERGVNFIVKRRSVLKGQITNLRGAIARNELDPVNVQLRFQRLTELFHAFEDLHVELEVLQESPENAEQFNEVQNGYYELATLVKAMQPAGGSGANDGASAIATSFANSTLVERQKSVKLPVADLPRFNGDSREWLTFKNLFESMIASRADLDDLNKFIYLRSCLTGAASKKLALFEASAENFKKGWDLLLELYEDKRILVSEHYAALIDKGYCKISAMPSVSTEALSKLIDDAQQHIAMLESLKIKPDQGMIVCLLERTLPAEVRSEWEKTLTPNVVPDFKQFYKFVHGYVSRVDKINRDANRMGSTNNKRANDNTPRNAKARRSDSGVRTLVTDTGMICTYCGQGHWIYKCAEFERLNLSQRWDAVKAKSLCVNCLRDHKPPCKSTHCKKCEKFHNTLLHNEKRNNAKGGDKPSGSTS